MAALATALETDRAVSSGAATGLALEKAVVRAAGRTLLCVDGLSFRKGELCGLIGHNGSGKSTLLKLLARQTVPDAGAVRLGGRPVAKFDSREFARRVAWLPQSLPAAESLTVAELVAQGRYPWHGALGRFSGEHRRICNEAMELTGVSGFAGRLVETLSGGERQRAWLAMLVAQAPQCLLLDEPISALDLEHQMRVMDLIRACACERGMAVVTVLHDVNIAARFCDRIVALRGGRLIHDSDPAAIMRPAVLEEIYGIPMRVIAHPDTGAALGFAR